MLLRRLIQDRYADSNISVFDKACWSFNVSVNNSLTTFIEQDLTHFSRVTNVSHYSGSFIRINNILANSNRLAKFNLEIGSFKLEKGLKPEIR